MHSFLPALRLSLRRTRADWPVVAAAWLITLLATVLFAAGPIYSSAAAIAGLRRTLADAPASDTGVAVSVYGTPAYVAGVDTQVQADLRAALSPLTSVIVRDGRASATLALPASVGGQTGDQAMLGFLDGLSAHAHLVQGAWPAQDSAANLYQVAVLQAVAADLRLSVGQEFTLVAPQVGQLVGVPVRVAGIFSIDDPADPYWHGDQQLTTGIVQQGGQRILGPFITTPDGVLANPALTSVHLRWAAFPDFDGLTVDNVAAIRGSLDSLKGRLPQATPGSLSITTGLPDILANADRSLLVARTELVLLMAQLAIMAGYAIVLTASVLVDHRRVETALLRSRGAGPRQIAWLALVEGLLLVVPAVLVAPWLALGEVSVLNLAGPLAASGLSVEPTITADSYLLAGAAGLLCLVLLVLPAFLAARSFASEERELSRQETRPLAQRMGIDTVLLAVSAIALWQLSLYGAPLTRTVQGTLGFDPLLVAAPALGLLAGGILALRILPLLAAALEAFVSRGREVVASLGARHLARRPLRYTRTSLLMMLALSLGVFALSYASTWSDSQQDQAAYQAGADVRAVVHGQPAAQPVLTTQYAAIPGVLAAMPVERSAGGAALGNQSFDLLAVNAAAADSIVRFRSDEAAQPLDQLMRPLRDERPAPGLVTLPQGAAYLRVGCLLDLWRILPSPWGLEVPVPVKPDGARLTVTAIVRDQSGLIYSLDSQPVTVAGRATPVFLSLGMGATTADGPLELAGLEVDVAQLAARYTTARFGVLSMSSSGSLDGPWSTLSSDAWAVRLAGGSNGFEPVAGPNLDGTVMRLGVVSGARMLLVAHAIDALDSSVPAIANPAFLAATGARLGDTVPLTIDRARRPVSITGVVDTFPTTDPSRPLLVVDEPTLSMLRLQSTGLVRRVDEWWLAVAPGTSDAVAATLRGDAFGSPEVVSAVGRARSLSTDPVALGIIGALLLGSVATGVFALVTLVVGAAVSARQRRTELALLRALGLSAGQLSRWMWLENGSLVLVSLIGGTAVGVVISAIALPYITVTQQAATPVPAVLVNLPWDRILALDLVVVVALGIAVTILAAVLRRMRVGSILRLGED